MRFPILLVWLLVTLCSLEAQAKDSEPAQVMHLLTYLAVDYPDTVAAGQVVNASEYSEQQEFVGRLQVLLQGLPARPQSTELQQAGAALQAAITARQPGPEVTRMAHQLEARIAELYAVQQIPSLSPDPQRATALYQQQCAICHGETGRGDGPASPGLVPPPTNLTQASRLDQLSLYDLHNVISLGIAGTEMPAFAEQLDERQRWDLAVYVAGLSASQADTSGLGYSQDALFVLTPAEVAARDGAAAVAGFRALRAQPPQPLGGQQLISHSLEMLDKSFAAYRAGERERAYDLSVAAYLEGFEPLEGALKNINAPLGKATEAQLMAYRQALRDGLPEEQLAAQLALCKSQLAEVGRVLDSGALSTSVSFISALLILLREGVEAILVLAAILAFLRNTGQQQALRSVHLGWLLACLAGLATWALAAYVIQIGGAQREVMEGGSALFAAAMVLWLGVWMHNRRHAAAWQDYIRSSLGGGRLGFALLAFLAIYRELFEIILFYETLWLQAGPTGQHAVLAGAATALLLLLVIAWVILRGSAKLPLKQFFTANAALLCGLAVVFAGQGVVALQEAGLIASQPLNFIEVSWLGIKADAYSLSAQALVLLIVALFYGQSFLAERRLATK